MKKNIKEFKAEALKLSDEIGVKKATSQLGLQYYTLADWRKEHKAGTKVPPPATDANSVRESVKTNAVVSFFWSESKKYSPSIRITTTMLSTECRLPCDYTELLSACVPFTVLCGKANCFIKYAVLMELIRQRPKYKNKRT